MTEQTLTPPAVTGTPTTTPSAPEPTSSPWDGTLALLAAIVASADLGVQLVAGIIPPLLVFGLLGLIGVALLRRRPRAGRITLLVISLIGVAAGVTFALPALAHPDSPIDFIHGVTSLPLRAIVVVAAIGALRRAGGAVPVRRAALGVLAVAVVGSIAASLTGSGVTAGPDDAVLTARDITFVDGDDLTVAAGQRLVVENADPIRHTFTVEGTEVDVELPAGQAVAVEADLPPGTYDYICAVPGHEQMAGTLTVAG